jgi:hypothetical protein
MFWLGSEVVDTIEFGGHRFHYRGPSGKPHMDWRAYVANLRLVAKVTGEDVGDAIVQCEGAENDGKGARR